jgi:hypothetical protein
VVDDGVPPERLLEALVRRFAQIRERPGDPRPAKKPVSAPNSRRCEGGYDSALGGPAPSSGCHPHDARRALPRRPDLLPVVVWLYWSDETLRRTAMLVWTVVVRLMDNVVRPLLIRRGADLPLLLIFAGVIGGLIAFAVIGLFIVPVVLAVTYPLPGEWVEREA